MVRCRAVGPRHDALLVTAGREERGGDERDESDDGTEARRAVLGRAVITVGVVVRGVVIRGVVIRGVVVRRVDVTVVVIRGPSVEFVVRGVVVRGRRPSPSSSTGSSTTFNDDTVDGVLFVVGQPDGT